LTVKLDGSWKDTIVVLPKGLWGNRLTGGVVAGGVISMKMLLKDFPVALLVREDVGAGENNA
jgi:(1->4)-alpha-D-glucan 1-alpha-D-glucosylmutase